MFHLFMSFFISPLSSPLSLPPFSSSALHSPSPLSLLPSSSCSSPLAPTYPPLTFLYPSSLFHPSSSSYPLSFPSFPLTLPLPPPTSLLTFYLQPHSLFLPRPLLSLFFPSFPYPLPLTTQPCISFPVLSPTSSPHSSTLPPTSTFPAHTLLT